MGAMTVRRVAFVALALGIVVAAVVWVSAVRFKDHASAADCGVPLGAALHGQQVPSFFVHMPTNLPADKASSGVLSVPVGTSLFVTVCRGEARTRLAISAGAIIVAVGGLVLGLRRWGRSPPASAL
jgi:hypothetical protein